MLALAFRILELYNEYFKGESNLPVRPLKFGMDAEFCYRLIWQMDHIVTEMAFVEEIDCLCFIKYLLSFTKCLLHLHLLKNAMLTYKN